MIGISQGRTQQPCPHRGHALLGEVGVKTNTKTDDSVDDTGAAGQRAVLGD